MDKEQAVKVLTSELVKHSDVSIVCEAWQKEQLIKDAKCWSQIANPFPTCYRYYESFNSDKKDDSGDTIYANGWMFSSDTRNAKGHFFLYYSLEEIIGAKENCAGANYFFTNAPNKNNNAQGMNFLVTPYSIIGEKEERNLRELFYKDVPPKTLCAMKVLGIKDFIDIYQSYINLDPMNAYLLNTTIRRFMDIVDTLKFDSDKEIQKTTVDELCNISKFNSELKQIGVKTSISTTEFRKEKKIRKWPNFIRRENISQIVKKIESRLGAYEKVSETKLFEKTDTNLLESFYNFVFTLPEGCQNIKTNKHILQLYGSNPDYMDIWENEYSKGKYFQEYFDYMNSEQQKTVASRLKVIPRRNLANDSFLWSKGFKDVKLDYMDLYKDNARGFIDYFSSRGPEEKKIIIKDIMICDYTNKPVADWLDENELDLVREVSMNG